MTTTRALSFLRREIYIFVYIYIYMCIYGIRRLAQARAPYGTPVESVDNVAKSFRGVSSTCVPVREYNTRIVRIRRGCVVVFVAVGRGGKEEGGPLSNFIVRAYYSTAIIHRRASPPVAVLYARAYSGVLRPRAC